MLRRIKNGLIYFITQVACFVIGIMPSRWVRTAGRCLGALAHAVAGYERNCARRQLQTALGVRMTIPRSRRLTRGVFNRLAWNAVELVHMSRNPNLHPIVHLGGNAAATLADALALGRGVIFVTGHIGNWELMAATLARLGYPIFTVAKRSYDPRFTKMIEAARLRFGVRVIYRGDKGAAAAMLRVLRNNGILGFLIDQDTDVPSITAPFFGRPAKTPSGPAVFAHRTFAPMVGGAIFRKTADGSHRIEIVPIGPATDVVQTTARLNQFLENRIRRHPTEWVWFHRRWKSTEQRTAA